MSNTKQEELNQSVHHWESLKTLLWLVYSAKNEDNAEIRIDNALERIASTMKRNSEVKTEVTSVLEDLEKKRLDFGGDPGFVDILESAIKSTKERYAS